MRLTSIKLTDFRNLSEICICPGESVNILYGNNAHGKTNLIEAIWLFTGNASFRGGKLSELVQFEKQTASLAISFQDREREQTAVMKLGNKREMTLNQVPLKTKAELAGHFYCVIFSPDDLDFLKGSPKIRRKFLDEAISQIKPQYLDYLDQYQKTLEQRNALLKDLYRNPSLCEMLDIWDYQLAKLGTILTIYRADYTAKLKSFAEEIYRGISSDSEAVELSYQSTGFEVLPTKYDDETIEMYYQALKANQQQDVKQGFTGVGIHRDDLDVLINGRSAKTFGSQGQKRSCILTIKLAEAKLLQKVTGEMPVMLLDDVMSELDAKRQDYILNHVKDSQVFITCCDIFNTVRLKDGKIFRVEQGSIVEMDTKEAVDVSAFGAGNSGSE